MEVRGDVLWLLHGRKLDLPQQRQGPFHPANSLTSAASFLLAFDMLHFVPMTKLQSRWGFAVPLKARPADSLKRFLTLRGTGSVTASQRRFKLKKNVVALYASDAAAEKTLLDFLQLQGKTMWSHWRISYIISPSLKWFQHFLWFCSICFVFRVYSEGVKKKKERKENMASQLFQVRQRALLSGD